MAIIGQDFEIYVNGADLADALDSFQPSSEMDELETTKLGNSGSKSFIPTLAKGTLTMQGCYEHDETNADETENILRTAFESKTAAAISCSMGAVAVGGVAFMLDALQTNLTINTTPSNLVMVDVSATGDKGVDRGVWLFKASAEGATATGSSVDNSAATTNGGIFHAHSYDDADDADATDVAFTLEHSVNGSTWADLIASTAIGDTLGHLSILVEAGTTVNRYLRVKMTATTGLAYGVACFTRL